MAGPLRNNPRTERAQRARMRGRRSPRTSRGDGLPRPRRRNAKCGRGAPPSHAWQAEPATLAWRRGGRASVAQPAHGTRAARTRAWLAESANLSRRRAAPASATQCEVRKGRTALACVAGGARDPRMAARRQGLCRTTGARNARCTHACTAGGAREPHAEAGCPGPRRRNPGCGTRAARAQARLAEPMTLARRRGDPGLYGATWRERNRRGTRMRGGLVPSPAGSVPRERRALPARDLGRGAR
jgi:hypothetical protein